MRPQALIDADAEVEAGPDDAVYDAKAPSCSHCRTRKTSVWRRSKDGAQLCNACGVYQRLRGKVTFFLWVVPSYERLLTLFFFLCRTDL